MKSPKLKFFYVYFNETSSRSDFSHPEIRLYVVDPCYPTCHDKLIDFTTQANRDENFSVRKSYTFDISFQLNNYHTTTMKMINKLTKDMYFFDSYTKGAAMKKLLKALRKAKIERRYLSEIDGYGCKQFVPKYVKSDPVKAAEWYKNLK